MADFKVGDIVQLKSGGPKMTVAAICQQPNREAILSLHIDSTSGTAFVPQF